MQNRHIDRRRLIALGASSATAGAWSALGGPALRAQQNEVPPPTGELVSFLVQISGLPEASKNIREIAIDEFTIDPRLVNGRDLQVNMVTYIDCTISAYLPPRLALPPLGDPCAPDRLEEEVRFVYRDWTVRA